MNFYTDSTEWQYLFKHGMDWDTLLPLYYPQFPTSQGFTTKEEVLGFFEELLKTTGKWAGESLAPRATELDQKGDAELVNERVRVSAVLKQTYQEAKDLDLFGLASDPRYGGMGIPAGVGMISYTQVARACLATSVQLGFFTGIADMIERFCESDIQEKFIPMINRGEISGAMCLTEPSCGSDVGALTTSAEKQPDGTYHLNGSKCFITNGGGGLSFVLARVKGAAKGLEGISLFFCEEWILVPNVESGGTERKHNYRVTKIEEKMGLHGSPTCEIVYENTIGRLVGKENDGFKIMLHLMNEARLTVGLQGLGGIEAAISKVKDYAESRKQFGKPLAELPLYKRNLNDFETERDGIRALMVDTISNFDIFQKLHLKKIHHGELNHDETRLFAKSSKVLRRRTPLVKYYGAEANAMISQKAIQAFGGYGFMVEYDIERIHRDSFAILLYEGTSQIQALMAMKDLVKNMMREPGKFVQSLVTSHPIGSLLSESDHQKSLNNVRYEFRKNVAQLIMRCFKPELSLSEFGFRDTILQLNKVFKKEYWEEANRFDKLMVHAETLCQALSYKECLKVLAKHASLDPSRVDLYNRYLRLVAPRLAAIYSDWGQFR